ALQPRLGGGRRGAYAGAAQDPRAALRAPPPPLRLSGIVDEVSERVLLVEDDARLAGMVSEYLGAAGFDVATVAGGAAALERLGRQPYDALVLDLALPDIDGLEVCRRLRARWNTPVLMLTARGEPMDRVVGLEIGADDYLAKPFEPRELLARLCALACCDSADWKSIAMRVRCGSTARKGR